MRTPILVLPPRYTQDSIALWKAATAAGWKVERLSSWHIPEWLKDAEFVFYGEPLLAAAISSSTRMKLVEPAIDWLTTLPEKYRKREVRLTDLADARRMQSPRFVKPAVEKCFSPKVYRSGVELSGFDTLPDSTPVLVAEPVKWDVEFRCFVLQRNIVTMSPYLRNGELAQTEDGRWECSKDQQLGAADFAQSVLADKSIALPSAIVLDVGKIADRGWAVVEINAAWGSGIYGCDPVGVLSVVRHACLSGSESDS